MRPQQGGCDEEQLEQKCLQNYFLWLSSNLWIFYAIKACRLILKAEAVCRKWDNAAELWCWMCFLHSFSGCVETNDGTASTTTTTTTTRSFLIRVNKTNLLAQRGSWCRSKETGEVLNLIWNGAMETNQNPIFKGPHLSMLRLRPH